MAQIRLLLDTVAPRTLLKERASSAVDIDSSIADGEFPMTTVSGATKAPLVRAPSLAALGIERREFVIAAHTLPPSAPIDGLDFLVGLRLTLDMRRGELAVA